jgi:FMN phosphatase YigB (HAD superfamily)
MEKDDFFLYIDTPKEQTPCQHSESPMEELPVDYSKQERLVVFDFDNTIYATDTWKKISCDLMTCPIFELADRIFMEKVLRGLEKVGVKMGVASFGKKSIIINCMNTLLYGNRKVPKEGAYFNERNVVTVPDVKEQWKKALNKISSTFKQYVKRSDGNVDQAFDAFLQNERPERNRKYWCLSLDPSAKLDMIELIRQYYNETSGERPIQLSEIRYFDDNPKNVFAARKGGVMAHLVPRPGITQKWWEEECEKIDAGELYFPEKAALKKAKTVEEEEEASF